MLQVDWSNFTTENKEYILDDIPDTKESPHLNKTREFEVTGYYYIEDNEQYLVYCEYDNRTATIGIDEDNLTIRDYQDEDKMLEDFKLYLQKENQQHDIFNLPAIEDLHPITAYLVDEMERSENNMIFIDEDGFSELEEKFHKPWNQIEAELESDIERFNLEDVLTLVCHEEYGKFVDPEIVAYGDLQCAFSKEVYHPPVEKKEKEHKAAKKKHKSQGFSR